MIVKLASTDAFAIYADIEALISGWSPSRHSPLGSSSFIKLPPVVFQEAEFDLDWNMISGPRFSDEIRYDIILPDDTKLPALRCRVFPEFSDHKIY